MKITQVRFPCGRIGLEVETGEHGGQGGPSYSYYYNGANYDRDQVSKDGVTLVFDYYGRMMGLVRVNKRFISPYDLFRIASSNFMESSGTERPHTPLPDQGSGASGNS
jgi:hypothetical protein